MKQMSNIHYVPPRLYFMHIMKTVTMLRDPMEQFVSLLDYRQRQINTVRDQFPATYLARLQPLLTADLRTLIESPIRLIPDNPPTVFLGIRYDIAPYFKNGALGRQRCNWHNTELDVAPQLRRSRLSKVGRHDLSAAGLRL